MREMNPRKPIAIIGMGCRFPGAANLHAFWNLLYAGKDAITDCPSTPEPFAPEIVSHLPASPPANGIRRQGGFLSAVDSFDASFFNIAPREAAFLDPQMRLLLEIAWEAFEDAGEVPATLAESTTGVFIGATTNEYLDLQTHELSQFTFYALSNGMRSMLSGRLSFAFDLRGPALTVDAAFSSSLVAVHLACQSIWSGESPLALAGGVHVSLHPGSAVGFSQAGMLSPQSRCKAFDAEADGFVLSEGAGIILLKPLSQALADRNPIYAVIRGSAVTNDGKSGPFLFTPSQQGQEIMLRQAYQNAGRDPSQVDYIEAHAAGTQAGDPIEGAALSEILGSKRASGEPCYIGSVKTNIGHSQSAAGIAGFIKTVLCVKHRTLVPNLHFQTPHPTLPWKREQIKVVQQVMSWPQTGRPALAGVSAFGLSGTNAHIVVEEVFREDPLSAPQEEALGQAHLLLLSAKSEPALSALVQTWHKWLVSPDGALPMLSGICSTAALRRTHHEHRLAVVGATHRELATRLESFGQGMSSPMLSQGRSMTENVIRQIVFVFPGQGSQWAGMGQRFFEQEKVYRAALEECDQVMHLYMDQSLLNLLLYDQHRSSQKRIASVQPMLFAIQVALARLWISWGLSPTAVVGHSMGEVAAAHIAGILTLEDAARIICLRSQLLQQLSGQGAMVVTGLSLEQARQLIHGKEHLLSLAVSNSPDSTVLSGTSEAVREIREALQRREIFCRPVAVTVASHSACVDPILEPLALCLQDIKPQRATLQMYSTVTTRLVEGPECDAFYWVRNVRETVLFAPVIQQLLTTGHTHFLEISPQPLLSTPIQQCAQHASSRVHTFHSWQRDKDERSTLLSTIGALYTLGIVLDWKQIFPFQACVSLPNYPWQRERYWSAPTWEQLTGALPLSQNALPQDLEPEQASTYEIMPPGKLNEAPADQVPLRERLLASEDDERFNLLQSYLTSCIATTLGYPDTILDLDIPLERLGLDSLMFLEVRKSVTRDLGIQLSLAAFVQKKSVLHISQDLYEATCLANRDLKPDAD